jgi:hypothetical protein
MKYLLETQYYLIFEHVQILEINHLEKHLIDDNVAKYISKEN